MLKQLVVHQEQGTFEGLIKKLKESGVNPLFVIKLSSNGTVSGSIENVLTHNGDFHVRNTVGPWFQLKFKKHLFYPTGYAIKGGVNTWTFSRKWTIFGFNEENKDDESKFDILGTYENTGNTISGYVQYQIENDDMKEYKYIRIKSTLGNYNEYISFHTGGIELYGRLLPIKRCICSNKRFRQRQNFVFVLSLALS